MNVIELENINFSFKDQDIFKNLSIKVGTGQIVGIIGPNGIGKSVLFKIIAGLILPQSGEIKFNGESTSSNEFFNSIGALIENPGFIDRLSGFENLDILASINNKIDKLDIMDILNKVGLWENRNKKVKKYSLGMKKKLGIAQAIMEKPNLIILDEPMNALDEKSVLQIRKLLKDIALKNNTSIMIASHNKDDIETMCDVVYKIENKQVSKVNIS